MNLSLRLSTTATKISIWTAQNPLASRVVMLALPITIVAVASIFGIAHPPTGCTSGGCGGG